MTKAAVLYNFWSSFGINAYEENCVPEDAVFPYISFQSVNDSFGNEIAASGSLWYRTPSLTEINAKAEEVSAFIGNGGKIYSCDGGKMWIKRGTPFAQSAVATNSQRIELNDDLIKRKYINLVIEFFTEN